MIDLPHVSLVTLETREHELALLAIRDCKRQANFGDVVIFTDKPELFENEGRIVVVPDFPDKVDWSRFRWQGMAPHLKTSHMLYHEWDAWVCDGSMWSDDYLKYDFIGAPWWFSDGQNVGNGGFSLRSTALTRYMRKHRDAFPCTTCVDDDLLCRKYRLSLESIGFSWAPQKVAQDFAFECIRPDPNSKHFGFHGMFNWHWILNEDELMQRAEIAYRSDYIKTRERMWGAFCKNSPKIAERFAS